MLHQRGPFLGEAAEDEAVVGVDSWHPPESQVQLALAVAYAQIGQVTAANTAVQELLRIRPDFAAIARDELKGKWYDAALTEHLIEGLRKAGLDIAADPPSSAARWCSPTSTTCRTPRSLIN